MLDVGLLSVGSSLLPLLKGVSSLRWEPGLRSWSNGPQQNRRHGLRGRSILWPWCGCDRSWWQPHATPPGDGEAEAPLSARGYVELIGGVLEDSTQ
jgi:hypothetical protein